MASMKSFGAGLSSTSAAARPKLIEPAEQRFSGRHSRLPGGRTAGRKRVHGKLAAGLARKFDTAAASRRCPGNRSPAGVPGAAPHTVTHRPVRSGLVHSVYLSKDKRTKRSNVHAAAVALLIRSFYMGKPQVGTERPSITPTTHPNLID
jgi:hypothetical protein